MIPCCLLDGRGIKDEIIHIISGGDNVPSPSPFVPVFNELNERRTLAKANGLVALVKRLLWLEQGGLRLNARVSDVVKV